jgi:hypothetical protein
MVLFYEEVEGDIYYCSYCGRIMLIDGQENKTWVNPKYLREANK